MDPNRLKSIPLFSALTSEEARRLATFATETSVASGQVLIREGDYATELIVIEEGTAEVLQGGATIASLGPGEIAGEMGLLDHAPRSADVVASSPMRLIKLTHWELRRMSLDTLARLALIVEQRRAAIGRL